MTNLAQFFSRPKENHVTPTLEAPPIDSTSLTAHDRCDRCGAQAYLRVTLAAGELLFCGHHAKQHGTAVGPLALEVHSELARLEQEHGPDRITSEN